MDHKDQMRHHRHDVPAHLVWVYARPSFRNKGKEAYYAAVGEAARQEICSPIEANDIEVELLYSTDVSEGIRSDIDNVIKPTLDALKGIAFDDDRQVRSVTATLFDKNKKNTLAGMVDHIQKLFYSNVPHVVLVSIYSDSRLAELGGPELIKAQRSKERMAEVDEMIRKAKGNKMNEPNENGITSTPNDVAHDEKSDFQNFYKYYSNLLRTWLVAYGIGGPVILLTNDNVWSRIVGSGNQVAIGVMFLLGVAMQVALALLNKTVNWNLYFGFVSPSFRDKWPHRLSDKLSEQYWIDILIDGISIGLMAIATALAFAALV